jgi:asparagine synthase (glutamine-hydrolysing)
MCGIAGMVTATPDLQETLVRAELAQKHRGPDSQGIAIQMAGRWHVGLAHQRLAIIDLSPGGYQPMYSRDGRSMLIYNGEVFNYCEIREELRAVGFEFATDSDTEVVLTALEHWGPQVAFNRFNGMWAIAWLDLHSNTLLLGRDRVGVKPLHYCLLDGALYFSSEVKGILAMTGRKFKLNHQVVGEYLCQSLVEASEQTWFEGIQKVPPGHFTLIDLNQVQLHLQFKRYWSIEEVEPFDGDEGGLITRVSETFIDAVRLRLRSDVPVGVLLSGGLDSSAIAAVMRQVMGGDKRPNLLSAVSNDSRFDESPFIDLMARHIDSPVSKVTLQFEPSQAFELLEEVCWYNDEPVTSFSNVAHYLLMKKARDLGITVVLSGQGADELLCGYRKYLGFYLQHLVSEGRWIEAGRVYAEFSARGTILSQFSLKDASRYLPSFLRTKTADIRGPALRDFRPFSMGMQGCRNVSERQYKDIHQFSVPALLHTEDRMSMAFAREIRVPFMDYRIIELLAPLPTSLKLRSGWTKHIFRRALEPLLPPEIAWRKDKQGFINPESEWLRHELRPAITAMFRADSAVYDLGLIDRDKLLRKYEAYCNESHGRGRIFHREIFAALAIHTWVRRYAEWIQ